MPGHALLLVSSMLLLVMAPLSCADGAVGTGKSKISAVFMFGDSIVDPGNNNNRLTEARANFPPYGQDFPGGKATGRFSNGRVPGDMLASKLGVKEFLPPYIGDDLELSDLLTGVAFASGGSGYDPLTSIPAELNDIGAKRIGFFGIPPIGCCPSQRKHGSRECDTLQNQAAELFNSGIEKEIERLNAERNVHDSRFAYLDIYYNLLDLIQQHDFYGFQEVTEGCCGSNVLNAAIFIQYHPACPNAYDYIFWDSFHCTEKAYNIVIDEIFHQNLHYLM
ncbi:GDSL esterase/lipase EXL1-like isoform X3 [Triticum urartu]|uniref:GDSL esterase/lipase EXL1-like isoform X3 n=1 Tax=Triticum urartu TaxID=4572 RepID=UPI0020438B0F|nr:GDSL esterase/lipase EXL1-like isoform X3 [Triticum urartu]